MWKDRSVEFDVELMRQMKRKMIYDVSPAHTAHEPPMMLLASDTRLLAAFLREKVPQYFRGLCSLADIV